MDSKTKTDDDNMVEDVKVDTKENSQTEEQTMTCDPCLRDKVSEKATIYCCECSEMLCQDCHKHHRRNKYTSLHKLCEIKTFKDTAKLAYLNTIEKCENHHTEEVKYLCKDHDQLCCNECAVVTHRRCNTLVSIASVIESSINLEESKEDLEKMVAHARKLIQHETDKITAVSESEKAVRSKLESIKKEIDEAFKKMEISLLNAASEKSKMIMKSIGENMSGIEVLQGKLKESEEKLVAAKDFGKEQHVFLVNRELKAEIQQHEAILRQLHKNATVETVELVGDVNMRKGFQRCLGDLSVDKHGQFQTRIPMEFPQLKVIKTALQDEQTLGMNKRSFSKRGARNYYQ